MTASASSLAASIPLIPPVSTVRAPFGNRPSSIAFTSTEPSIYAGETSTVRRSLTGDKGRYTQADPLGVGGTGIMLPGKNSFARWSQKELERMRARGFSGATAVTGYAYADDTPTRATDPLGLFLWHCIAKALSPSSTSFPIDPTDFKKGFKKVCTYEVECESKDSLLAVPIKIEAFWQRPMPQEPCKCDKVCTFTVFGIPQTYLNQNLFGNVSGVYCSDFGPNSI